IRLDQGYCAHNASEEKINKGRGLYAGIMREMKGYYAGCCPLPQGESEKKITVLGSPAADPRNRDPPFPASGCGTRTGSEARKAARNRPAVRPARRPKRYLSSPCLPGTASPR